MTTNLSTVANLTTPSLLYHHHHHHLNASSNASFLPLEYDEYDPFAYNATTTTLDLGLNRIEELFNASSSAAPFDTPSWTDFNITFPSSTDFSTTSSDFDTSSSLFNISSSTSLSSTTTTTTPTTTTTLPTTSTETLYLNSSDASTNSSSDEAASSLAAYERFMDESRHWVQRVLVPLVMCIGVVGNSVSMVVLTRRKMRSSTNNYLTALAISDLLYLVFVFSLSLQHHPDIKHPRHWFYWQYVRYAFWLTDASSSTSIWLTVTFTIERYIAVSHPIKGKVLCTVSRAKKLIAVVFVLCFALTASTPHEWVVVTRRNPNTNQPFLALDYSRLGQAATYRHTYYWFTAVTFILLPLCLLAFFNFFLIQAVRTSKVQRRKLTLVSERDHYSHQQEHKITVMLIAVVILALVCQMPTAVLLLYSTVYEPPQGTKAFAIMRGLGNIFNLLNAVNAAANFILYCSFSDKYRRTFLVTFVPCLYHRQPPQSHSFVTSLNENTVGGAGGRCRGSDSLSIRSVSRRVSKASSTASPMPPRDGTTTTPSPRLPPGSFRENGIGSLDARVTLQFGCGRPKRSLTLSPPKPNAHPSPSQLYHGREQHPQPSSRHTGNTKWSPVEAKADTNHCQVGQDKLYNNTKVDLDLHIDGAPSRHRMQEKEEETLPTPGSSVEEDSPLELRFIDDDSCETCPSSPVSNARLEDEGEDEDEDKSNGGGRVSSQLTTRETLSSLAMLGSEAGESTIHSPD